MKAKLNDKNKITNILVNKIDEFEINKDFNQVK